MNRRKIEKNKSSNRKFKKGLNVHKKNNYTKPTRGGHRI